MSENIRRAKITVKKMFTGDKNVDVLQAEFDKHYERTELDFFTPFLKVAFPDGTLNKFAMTKRMSGDTIIVERLIDAAITKCAGNIKAQIVLESVLNFKVINSAVFTIKIGESIKDETNEYNEIPSAVMDLQHQLQEQLEIVTGDIETIEGDISAVETFMENSFVNTLNGESGDVTISKANVGLGNVDNTADLDKPLSSAAIAALAGKVDKVSGKGLSTEDYTTAEKTKLAGLDNYDDTAIVSALSDKVDKVSGKGLSTEDYTTAEKTKLDGLYNYDDSAIVSALSDKVDKVSGKGLSTEDYTTAEKSKLSGIESGAQANTVDSVNGQTGTVVLDCVPTSRTIAGNALTGDISAQTLTDSLVYMNATTDLDDVFND